MRFAADVLHLRYSEQTACFMILLKWPVGGPSSILTRSGKSLKTVDATHPQGQLLHLLEEKSGKQSGAVGLLHKMVPQHYCKPALAKKWLKKWVTPRHSVSSKNNLPEGKIARSGDIGEILATEFVNRKLDSRCLCFAFGGVIIANSHSAETTSLRSKSTSRAVFTF